MGFSVVKTIGLDAREAPARTQSGNALVVALIVLMVLTAASMAYMVVTKADTQISGNAVASAQALYAAEAGLTEGLHRMAFKSEVTNYIGPAGNPAPGWGRYIVLKSGDSNLDPDAAALASDGLDNNEDGIVDEPGESYPEVLTKQEFGPGQSQYPYVRVEYKTQGGQLVRFGDADNNSATPQTQNLAAGQPVLRLTSRGEQGTGTKVIEAEAVRFPLIDVHAAIWTGKKFDFSGDAFGVDGNDHYATAPYDTVPGGVALPGVLTAGPTSDAVLNATQRDNVTGAGGGIPSVAQTAIAYDFNALWSTLSSMADYKYTGTTTLSTNVGTLADPKIIVVDGNVSTATGWRGAGILIVNGNIDIMGHWSVFKGIVIVNGVYKTCTGNSHRDHGEIYGALVALGSNTENSVMGGRAVGSKTFYSSEAINAVQVGTPYTLAWWRER